MDRNKRLDERLGLRRLQFKANLERVRAEIARRRFLDPKNRIAAEHMGE